MNLGKRDDASLVREVLAGRREAFDVLVEKYYDAAFAVAFSRTGNRADAQDAAQESFLRAFTALPALREPARFAAWLMGIARNVTGSTNRTTRQQQSYQSRQIETSAVPDVETRDLHEFLRQQLESLDADDREVLLMHYFTGLPTREIGEALGVSRESAKKRLQRAREALSERVFAELGDAINTERPTDRAKKQAMAVVAAAPFSWTPTTTGSAVSAVGGLAAWKTAAAVVAVVAAIVIAVVLKIANGPFSAIAQGNERNPPENALAAAEKAGQSPEPGTVALAANASSNTVANAKSTTDPPSTGSAMAVCEILNEAAQPVVGAQVAIFSSQSGNVGPLPRMPLHEERSDARGWALFDNLSDGSYAVVARAEGLIGFGMNRVAQYGIGRIILRPVATIEGVVTDGGGTPVAGADIFVYRVRDSRDEYGHVGRSHSVKSDAKGHYALEVLGEGNWSLVVDANGFVQNITPPGIAPCTMNVTLERGHDVTIKVYRADTGAAVSGVELVLEQQKVYTHKRATTGADGIAHFTSLAAAPHVPTVLHDEFICADEDPTITIEAGSQNEFGVAVVPGYKVTGRVIDGESKAGVPGCAVNFVQTMVGQPIRRSSTTDSDGRFKFFGLRVGHFELRIPDLPKGYSLGEPLDRRHDEVTGANTPEITITLNNENNYGGVVEGKVVDQNGKPVPRAFVRAEIGFNNTRIVRADADGLFRIGGVKIISDLRLFAHFPGLATGGGPTHTVTAEGLHDIVLTVRPTGSINGFVKSNKGNPITLEHPAVKQVNPFETGTVFNHFSRLYADGAFRLSDLPPGDYPIYFDPETNIMTTGIVLPDATVPLKSGEHVENIILTYKERPLLSQSMTFAPQPGEPPKWTLSGRTTYADTGAPVTEYRMEIHQGGHISQPNVKDAEGKFTSECDRESVRVDIFAKGCKKLSQRVTKEEAARGELQFALQRGCVVEGVVVDDQGKPVPGARIVFDELPIQHDIDSSDAPTTLPDGSFRLDILDEQETTLFAVHPTHAVSSVVVSPKSSAPITTTITLRAGARIEGVITVGGEPARNASANVRPKQYPSHQKTIKCDSEGRFVFEHQMPITTDISAMPSDTGDFRRYRSEKREVELVEGETTTVDFDFPATESKIEGTVSVLNADIKGGTFYVAVDRDGVKERISSDKNYSFDSSGAFQTDDLPAGIANIEVSAILDDETRLTKSVTVELPAGTMVTQNIVFAGRCSVSGSVTGLPNGGKATVVAIPGDAGEPEDSPISQTLMADAIVRQVGVTESFRLSCLDAGTYTIRAIYFEPGANGPRHTQTVVTLSDGAEESVNLALPQPLED